MSLLFASDIGEFFFDGEGRTLSTGFFDSSNLVVFDLFDLWIISSNPSSVRNAVLHERKMQQNKLEEQRDWSSTSRR